MTEQEWRGILVLCGVAAYVAAVFLVVRRLVRGKLGALQSFGRKVILYGVALGGVAAIVGLGRVLPDSYLGLLFLVFFTLMAAFFAVMTAD